MMKPTGLCCLALLTSCVLSNAHSAVTIKSNVPYRGYAHNIEMSNGTVTLYIPTEYGPRIMYYGFNGSGNAGNVFAYLPTVTNATPYGTWHIRGGTRFWHAPENMPRTYIPDNAPVKAVIAGNTVSLTEPKEIPTGIVKSVKITMASSGTHVTVTMTLKNDNLWPVTLACWMLSAMHPGGTGIFPQEPFAGHGGSLLPSRPVVLWSYTNMADPRWTWGKQFILFKQNPDISSAQKAGFGNHQGWAAYDRNGLLFLKKFAYHNGATYPDYGCNNETYCSNLFEEVESVGPLTILQPGATVSHTENWWLFDHKTIPDSQEAIAQMMAPVLASTK